MIYMTPFNPETKQCTNESSITFYGSFDEVINSVGEPLCKSNAYVIYDDVIYSRMFWHYKKEPCFL